MKKTIFICLFLTLIAAAAFSQAGVIREIEGEVTLKAANSSVFVPAQVGSEVALDTIVSTGFKSSAVIAVGSSTLMVRPLTRLMLSEIQSSTDNENLNVNLQAGRVRVDVKPPAGTRANVTVQSPSATASVRGTTFEMDTFNLDVFEGRVVYEGSDGIAVPVAAGSSSSVSASSTGSGGGSAQDPVEVTVTALAPPAPVGVGTAGETTAPAAPPVTTGGIGIDIGWGN